VQGRECLHISSPESENARKPIVDVQIKNIFIETLLDSGADANFCSKDIAIRLCKQGLAHSKPTSMKIRLPDCQQKFVKEEISVIIKICKFTWRLSFLVIPDLCFPMILGVKSLHAMRASINLYRNYLQFSFHPKVIIPFKNPSYIATMDIMSTTELPVKFSADDHRLEEVLHRFKKTVTTELGKAKGYTYTIQLKDYEPVRQAPFSLTPPKAVIMRQHIQKLLDLDIIEPSRSPYASPCFLIPKKSGDMRLVVDYRRVNAKIRYDAFPVPRPESVYQCLSGATIFTKLDMNMAYHQLPLAEESKPITAFVTTQGSFQYKFLPFGLAVSPAALNRIMTEVLGDLHYKFAIAYFDDIFIYSSSVEEHFQHLHEVLLRLEKIGLTVNPEKAQFCMKRVKCLGYVISAAGCQVDPDKIQSIQQLEYPKTLKQLQSFLGMVAYFSRFIKDFSQLAAPLNQLKKKRVKFEMGPLEKEAVEKLKTALSTAPVLKFPNFQKQFMVRCDSSDVALGAVLCQEFEDGLHPISYASRKLSDTERRYPILEREALGIMFALEKFQDYLLGTHFVLQVDNEALMWMISHPKQLGKIGRWVLKLSRYDFEVQHIKGTLNSVADALSRLYNTESKMPEEPSLQPMLNALHEVPESFLTLKQHQQTDAETQLILQRLNRGEDVKGYVERDGVLMKSVGKHNLKRIVVPPSVRNMLLYYFHDLDAQHPGITKTYRAIARRFWWTNLFADVRQYVRSCQHCQVCKPSNIRTAVPMASTTPTATFDKVYIDFCGPILRSSSGSRYVLVVLDAYSKWIETIPCSRATAAVTTKKLAKLWCTYGPPGELVSDNATVFRSDRMKRMVLAWGIKHIFTTPYQPTSNMVERSMRDLKSSLSIMIRACAESNREWDKFLPFFCYSHNSNISEVTQETPAKLFLGRELPKPIDRQWQIDRYVDPTPPASTEVVRNRIEQAHKKVKDLYDLNKRTHHRFRPGDVVSQRLHTVVPGGGEEAQKFVPRWSGPRRVIRFTTPASCLVEDVDDPSHQYRAHVSQLKPYHRRPEAA